MNAEPVKTAGAAASATGSLHERTFSKGRWWVLVAMALGVMAPMLDILMVNFALPSIQQDLGEEASGLQWIIDAYTLAFAALMLTGGWLGDLFGRRRFFIWGVVLFTLASAACGASGSTEQLIWFRALQGVGAALVVPGTLSILAVTFPDRGRGAAMGLWAAVSALALAAGPMVGGYVAENQAWNWIFLINIPIGVLALVIAALSVEESKDPTSVRRINVPGLVSGTAGLAFLFYGLVSAASSGWTDERTVGSLGIAAVLLISFLVIDARWSSPLLPLHLFRSATFTASNMVSVAVFLIVAIGSLFLAHYVHNHDGFSSPTSWVRLLPFTLAVLVASAIAARISDRHGFRSLMTIGCCVAAGAIGLFLLIEPSSSYFSLLFPASTALGLGIGLTLGPMTAAVMGSAELRHAGAASAVTNTFRHLGGALGIALLGAVATAAFKNDLATSLASGGIPAPEVERIVERVASKAPAGGASPETLLQQMPPTTPGEVLDRVATAAQGSFVEALHTGALMAVGFMLLAALVAAIFVRRTLGTEPEVKQGPPSRQEDALAVVEVIRTGESGEDSIRSDVPEVPVAAEAASADSASPGQDDTPAPTPLPETAAGGRDASDEKPQELTSLLFELPFKAGQGTVQQNLSEFLQRTLQLDRNGAEGDGDGAPLPPGVGDHLQAKTSPHIAVVAGYLLLEQRFGRVSQQARPEQAATLLVGACGGLKLWTLEEGDDALRRDFVEGMVKIVLEGIGSSNQEVVGMLENSPAEEPQPIGYVVQGALKESEVLELPEVPEADQLAVEPEKED